MIFSHDTHGIQFTWSLSTCGILSWSSQIPSAYETPHSVILSLKYVQNHNNNNNNNNNNSNNNNNNSNKKKNK